MDEQVKYTADDYELAESIADCPKDAESLAQTFADIRQQGRAEAQPNHLTAAVNARLAAAEKLAQAMQRVIENRGERDKVLMIAQDALWQWEAAGK